MKKMNVFVALLMSGAILMAGCSSSQWATQNNKTKGGVLGGAGGALLGAGIGAMAGLARRWISNRPSWNELKELRWKQ